MVDIEKLRALLAAATPGPWKCMQDGTAAWIDQGNVKKAVWLGIARGDQNRRDANLIAAAVNALPELLDKVERLRARTAALCDCALVARAGCPECGGVGAVIVEGRK